MHKPTYTKEELKAFELEMGKYKLPKGFYDENQYLKDKGALSSRGAIIMGELPLLYEVLRDKLNQLYKLQGRREYAIKKQAESLDNE